MKQNALSTDASSTSRCIHSTSHGNRCRMLAPPSSRYCHSHFRHAKLDAASLAAELSLAAASLASPEDVHRVLAKIFLALCDDRISLKKAGTLGYIAQMLLRSHREIAIHKKLQEERDEKEELKRQQDEASSYHWNAPRPDRSDPPIIAASQPHSESEAKTIPLPQSAESTAGPAFSPTETPIPSLTPTLTSPIPNLDRLFPIDLTPSPGLQHGATYRRRS